MSSNVLQPLSPEVSKLGFGCMRLPLQADGKTIDAAKSIAMLKHAYENGVNYFDTAWGYLDGQSEPFMGKVLKNFPRDTFYLASKMPSWHVQNLAEAKNLFARQLERCQVEWFDYYLLHSLTSKEEFDRIYTNEKVLEFLQQQKSEGRIRRFGYSFHGSLPFMKHLLDSYPWDFVQIQLNYLDWDIQQASVLYELARARNLPVIIMEPVRGGALATLNDRAAAILRQADPSRSLASWAIQYAAALPGVLTVLSGMSTMEQVLDNLATVKNLQPVTDEDKAILQQVVEAYLEASPIPCTACGYCLPCPFEVDIPGNFQLYNKAAGKQLLTNKQETAQKEAEAETTTKREELQKIWEKLPEENFAGQCRSCNACVPKCPQQIAIPERMQQIAALFDD